MDEFDDGYIIMPYFTENDIFIMLMYGDLVWSVQLIYVGELFTNKNCILMIFCFLISTEVQKEKKTRSNNVQAT